MVNFEVDEHPRPQTTLDGLKKLKSIFKENGLVTAGSASVRFIRKLCSQITDRYFQGICDGAGALVLASEEASNKNNLKPLARILAYSTIGVDPTIMGIGPVPAINAALKAAGKTINDMDIVEVQNQICIFYLNT